MGWRLRTPAIVFLLLGGFVFGSFFGFIQPDAAFGDLVKPVVAIAVAIILFEGSLNLNFKEIHEARRAIKQIVLVGAPVGWLLTALGAHYIGGLSWPVAIVFGGLLIVTGPTVIMPLLKHARLNTRVGSILKWEGIINDPIGVIFAVLAYEYFLLSNVDFSATEFSFHMGGILLAITIGSFVIGWALAKIMNHGWVPEFLKAPFLLSVVVVIFVLCNALLHESGLIAVTILGVVLANQNVTSIDDLKKFKESMTILLVSSVFIVLTAELDPALLMNIDWRGFAFIAALLFVIRPVVIAISSIGAKMNWKEVTLVGLIAPRGVVCAAIAGVMGPLMVSAGYPDGEKMLPLAFAIVLLTVFIHGLAAKPLGRVLGLAFPQKDGIIIVGATAWTIQFAQLLKERGLDVMIVDRVWHRLRDARLADLPIYYGEILSEETEHYLEFNKYNTLLAATDNPAYNALICSKYAHEMGRERVFQISADDEDDHERQQIADTVRGRTLAYEGLGYWDFITLFQQGWRFRATKVNADFNMDKIKGRKAEGQARMIGTIGENMRLNFSQAENPRPMKAGNTVILFENACPQENAELRQKKKQEKKEKKQKKKQDQTSQ